MFRTRQLFLCTRLGAKVPWKSLFTSDRSKQCRALAREDVHLRAEPLFKIPETIALDLGFAKRSCRVAQVAKHLRETGILKVSLRFPDPRSQYLEQLVTALHQNHGHNLPISHSALRGAFWDVRPSTTNFQAGDSQARSETTDEFPWHTDCSYESQPPRYFALHVLQHDRYGGGTLSLMSVKKLNERLSPANRASLSLPQYQIKVPPEFIKNPNQRFIQGSILVASDDYEQVLIRYRNDLLIGLSQEASRALEELETKMREGGNQSDLTLRLSAKDLPKGSVILIDNRRWLHARDRIHDEQRHLRRLRWDTAPFGHNGQ